MVKRIGKDILIMAAGGYILAGAVAASMYGANDLLSVLLELSK